MFFGVAVVGGGDAVHADMAQHRRRTNFESAQGKPCSRGHGRGDPESNTSIISLKSHVVRSECACSAAIVFFLHFGQAVRRDHGVKTLRGATVCGSNSAPFRNAGALKRPV